MGAHRRREFHGGRGGGTTARVRARWESKRAGGEDVAKRRKGACTETDPHRSVPEPSAISLWREDGRMECGAGMVSQEPAVEMLQYWAWFGFDFWKLRGTAIRARLREMTEQHGFLGSRRNEGGGGGEDKQAGGRGPEGTGLFMRAVRAMVSLFGNSLGGAMRKEAKVTSLGSGMLRIKGEEQLLASRETQAKPVLFQGIQVGKASGSPGVRRGTDLKSVELGVRRRKRV